MANRIDIQNNSQTRIPPQKRLRKLLTTICETLAVDHKSIELIFLRDDQIRPYYKEYFGEDRATDVIAFPMEETSPESRVPGPGSEEEMMLGCVVISVDTAKRQAKELGHSVWNEIRLLVIHGFLHLLGYDHAKKKDERIMKEKEQELLEVTVQL